MSTINLRDLNPLQMVQLYLLLTGDIHPCLEFLRVLVLRELSRMEFDAQCELYGAVTCPLCGSFRTERRLAYINHVKACHYPWLSAAQTADKMFEQFPPKAVLVKYQRLTQDVPVQRVFEQYKQVNSDVQGN